MEWKRFSDLQPTNGKWVLAWRRKQEKFQVVRFVHLSEPHLIHGPFSSVRKKRIGDFWETNGKGHVEVDPDDHWLEFPSLEFSKKFDP